MTDPNMTRFMMTLEDAVDLVLYAFAHGQQGDLFIQKAPAATIKTLAESIIDVTLGRQDTYEGKLRVIGTRHGEKLYETLLTREEKAKAEDLGRYYRVPMDDRDLNYDKYFEKGIEIQQNSESYTSHNTERLDKEGMKALLVRYGMKGR